MPTKTKTKQTFDVKTVDTPSDLVVSNNQLNILSTEEKTALTYHENVIEKGLETFIEVGQSLQYIRDNRLYRAEYKSFKEYIEQRWHFQVRQAHRIITGIETTQLLTDAGVPGDTLPNSEKVARPLAKLKDDPKLMAQAWIELTGKTREEYEAGLRKSEQPTHKEVEAKVKEYEAQIEALKNKQTSLLEDLEKEKRNTEWQGNVIREFNLKGDPKIKELEKTVENQKKQIQETNSKLSQLEVKERELKEREEKLNKIIEVKVEEQVTEKTEEELKKLDKQKADLEKEKAQIKKELKDVESLKRTAQRQKDNLDSTQEWITNFQLTNEFLAEVTNELKKYKKHLQKNPDLSELEEKDRLKVEEKIKNLIVDFNDNLHSLGGAINYLNGAVVKFNNHALRVLDVEGEVTDNE